MTDNAEMKSVVRAEIARITARFEAADKRMHAAQVVSKPEEARAANAEKEEAAGDFWAAAEGLADLFLLMLRYAAEHRPEQLSQALAGGMRAELNGFAEAIARSEHR